MKILTIVDLQNEFTGFINEKEVLSYVVKLVKSGAYDYIVNLRYGGGLFGHDDPTPNIPIIRKALKGKRNVIDALKQDDDGSYNVLDALRGNKKRLTKKDLEIDMVGVNLPYCVGSTALGLRGLGVKAKNIRVLLKGCSQPRGKRHKENAEDMIDYLKCEKFKLIQ